MSPNLQALTNSMGASPFLLPFFQQIHRRPRLLGSRYPEIPDPAADSMLNHSLIFQQFKMPQSKFISNFQPFSNVRRMPNL